MIFTIKNGLFKHLLKDEVNSSKKIAVKLFTNGWAITDTVGNTLDCVKYCGENRICSDIWSAEMIHEQSDSLIRPPMVTELKLTTGHGIFSIYQDRSRMFRLFSEGTEYRITGIMSKKTSLELPDCFTSDDAIRLFCFLQIAVHDDDIYSI